jgi:hypothetical protein
MNKDFLNLIESYKKAVETSIESNQAMKNEIAYLQKEIKMVREIHHITNEKQNMEIKKLKEELKNQKKNYAYDLYEISNRIVDEFYDSEVEENINNGDSEFKKLIKGPGKKGKDNVMNLAHEIYSIGKKNFNEAVEDENDGDLFGNRQQIFPPFDFLG